MIDRVDIDIQNPSSYLGREYERLGKNGWKIRVTYIRIFRSQGNMDRPALDGFFD
jgi:hypothetical protein